MKTQRVSIHRDDLFCYRLKDRQEVSELFGEDYLEDYGVDVPSELLTEYKSIMSQYEALQDKLRLVYNKSNRG
jgi:hypothetical protein